MDKMGGRKEKERQKERGREKNTENLLQHLLEKQQHSRENTVNTIICINDHK